MPSLTDRLILITGASRGLGAALAEACAAEGARLILLARTRGALEEVDDRVRSLGAEATLLPLDLADLDAVDRLGPSIYQRFGRLDGLARLCRRAWHAHSHARSSIPRPSSGFSPSTCSPTSG